MEKGFTLVIPLYNKVKHIKNTLDSVLNNHGVYPFRCIIVDDDSTDGSSEIALEYDEKYPYVFTYIKKTHRGLKGPVYARNVGIKLADTEYIGFLDADDELCAGFIDMGCEFLDKNGEYSLYGRGYRTRETDDNGNVIYMTHGYKNNDIHTFVDYITNGLIDHTFTSYIYRTDLVRQCQFTDVFCEDVVFKLKYIYYNEPIYLDSRENDSIIWNIMSRESGAWEKQNIVGKNGLQTIFESLSNEIPGFKYWIEMINDTEFFLHIHN